MPSRFFNLLITLALFVGALSTPVLAQPQGPVPDQTAERDQPISLDLTAYEPQVGDGGRLLWFVTGAEHCAVSGEYSADDVLTFTPDPGFLGSDTVTLHMVYVADKIFLPLVVVELAGTTASDALDPKLPNWPRSSSTQGWRGRRTPYSQDVTLTWTNANAPPTLDGLPDQVFDHVTGPPGTIDLWAYAWDAETPASGLTYTFEITPPIGAGVTISDNRYVYVNPSTSWCGYTDVTVRATDPGGLWDSDTFRVAVTWSCPSTCWTPGTAVLVTPPDGDSTLDTTPTFAWNAVSDADEYHIQVDDDADFSNPEIDASATSTEYTPAFALSIGSHTWRVRGHNTGGGCDLYGDWSSPRTLDVISDFYLAVAPPTQTITQGLAVTFTVHLTGINGFSEPVTLGVSGVPSGTMAAWVANPVVPTDQTILTLTTATTTAVGTHPLSIRGSGGGLTHTAGITLSVVAAPQSVRFVVTGDSRGDDNGVNTAILSEIVQAILDEDVDFILFAGDLVTKPSDQATLESRLTTWRDTMQPLYDADIGVYPCRGNHETGSKAAWDNVFAGIYALPSNGPSGEENITFSFSHGNVFIVGLDQYVTPHRVNQTWLDAQFASNALPHVFVFGHEPAFKVGHTSCLDDYPADRDTFWSSITAEGGRVYWAGHDHFYDHARLDDGDGEPDDDLHQYIVGTAGAPLYDDGAYDGDNGAWTPHRILHEKQYGYALVEIDDLTATLTWKHRTAAGVYEAGGDVFAYTVSPEPPEGSGTQHLHRVSAPRFSVSEDRPINRFRALAR